MSGLWGPATPYILAVYGIAALGVGALVVWSLWEARRWARKARALEQEQKGRKAAEPPARAKPAE